MAARKPDASRIFRQKAADQSLSPVTRSWVRVLALISERLLLDEPATETVSTPPEQPAQASDQALLDFHTELIAAVSKGEPCRMDDAAPAPGADYEYLRPFVNGLIAARSEKEDEAIRLLKQFRAAAPSGKYEWIQALKPLATILIEEITIIKDGNKALKNGPIEQRTRAAVQLRKIGPTFAKRAAEAVEPYTKEIAQFEATPKVAPKSGTFRILNRHTRKYLASTSNSAGQSQVVQTSFADQENQLWEIAKRAGGAVGCRCVKDGQFLAIPADSYKPSLGVHTEPESEAPEQSWYLIPDGNHFFLMRSVANDLVLAVANMDRADGTLIGLWYPTEAEDHYWHLEPVAK